MMQYIRTDAFSHLASKSDRPSLGERVSGCASIVVAKQVGAVPAAVQAAQSGAKIIISPLGHNVLSSELSNNQMSWIAKTEPGAVSRWVDVDVVVAVVREGNRVTDCDTHVVVGLDGPLCMKFRQITPIYCE